MNYFDAQYLKPANQNEKPVDENEILHCLVGLLLTLFMAGMMLAGVYFAIGGFHA